MATDYTIPKDEYRALVAKYDKLLDGFHAMKQLYEDELKHALAENTKLRKDLEFANNGWEKDSIESLNLQAENDKLRELVRDALTTISWCTIDCCPSDSKKRELNERARELGVEVG